MEHKAWPASLSKADARVDLQCKGVVFEFSSGNLLRLDAQGRVAQAWHGLASLPDTAIAELYGEAPWQHFDDLRAMRRHPAFLVFLTYFDIPAAALLAHAVQLADSTWQPPSRSDGDSGYEFLAADLFAAFEHEFNNVDAFTPRRGTFFPALQDHPEAYLLPRPALATWLKRRRDRGQHTFLATNSCLEFAQFLLAFTLGQDWRECFDLIIMDACKGAFFTKVAPLCRPDAAGARAGEAVTSVSLPSTQLYVNGSASLVEAWVAGLQQAGDGGGPVTVQLAQDGTVLSAGGHVAGQHGAHPNPIAEGLQDAMEDAVSPATDGTPAAVSTPSPVADSIWYCGDHLHGDVAAAAGIRWNTVAVVEEMAQEGGIATLKGAQTDMQPNEVDVSGDPAVASSIQQLQGYQGGAAWTADWFLLPGGGPSQTVDVMLKRSTLAVPDIAVLPFLHPTPPASQ